MIIGLDTETGGFNAMQIDDNKPNALLTIGALAYHMRTNTVLSTFSIMINPDTDNLKVEDQALNANGLSLSLLREDGKPEIDAMRDFNTWLESIESKSERFIPLGHNIQFDLGFIEAAAYRSGVRLKKLENYQRIETYTCASMLRLAGKKMRLNMAIDYLVTQPDFIELTLNENDAPEYRTIIEESVKEGPQCHRALQDACYSLALFRYVDGKAFRS